MRNVYWTNLASTDRGRFGICGLVILFIIVVILQEKFISFAQMHASPHLSGWLANFKKKHNIFELIKSDEICKRRLITIDTTFIIAKF